MGIWGRRLESIERGNGLNLKGNDGPSDVWHETDFVRGGILKLLTFVDRPFGTRRTLPKLVISCRSSIAEDVQFQRIK